MSDWSSDVCSSDRAAAIQNEGEEAARPRKVPFPECVAGAAGKGRVQNPRYFRLLSQPLCYLKSACLMLGQSDLQGAQPSAGEIAIIGAGRLTESVRRLAQRWPQGRSRSEENKSELQSLMRISYAVLVLNKKNKS